MVDSPPTVGVGRETAVASGPAANEPVSVSIPPYLSQSMYLWGKCAYLKPLSSNLQPVKGGHKVRFLLDASRLQRNTSVLMCCGASAFYFFAF